VHRAPGPCTDVEKGGSERLVEQGGAAARLRGGAAALEVCARRSARQAGGMRRGGGLPGARRKDRTAGRRCAASVGLGQGLRACLRGAVVPCASRRHG
jgi:hypothetical protein